MHCRRFDIDNRVIREAKETGDGSLSPALEKKKNRIYEVTVDVTKSGDSKTYATLTSTMSIKE